MAAASLQNVGDFFDGPIPLLPLCTAKVTFRLVILSHWLLGSYCTIYVYEDALLVLL